MTDIEQAIIELNLMKCKYSHIRKNDSEWFAIERKNDSEWFAIEAAQEALREKQERDKGCEYCCDLSRYIRQQQTSNTK